MEKSEPDNVADAFKGFDGGGSGYHSDTNSVQVIPEPVTIGLFGMGGVLSYLIRRRQY